MVQNPRRVGFRHASTPSLTQPSQRGGEAVMYRNPCFWAKAKQKKEQKRPGQGRRERTRQSAIHHPWQAKRVANIQDHGHGIIRHEFTQGTSRSFFFAKPRTHTWLTSHSETSPSPHPIPPPFPHSLRTAGRSESRVALARTADGRTHA